MVGFGKWRAFTICCVLLVCLISAGDANRLSKTGGDEATKKIVWMKVSDQRITPPAKDVAGGGNASPLVGDGSELPREGDDGEIPYEGDGGELPYEGGGSEPARIGAQTSLSREKEIHLQYLASRQGQAVADDYREVLAGYEADKNVCDIVLFGDSLIYRGDWSKLSGEMTIANRGINGDTINGLEHRVDQIVPMKPRALFLLIGVNDLAVKMRPEVCEAYERILDRLISELPDTTIYVQSILPVRDDLRNIMSNDAIALANEQIKQMTSERGLCYIDVYVEMLNPEERRLYYNYQLDGLHLSEQGYGVWKQVIKPYITSVEWQAAIEAVEMEKSRWRVAGSPSGDGS